MNLPLMHAEALKPERHSPESFLMPQRALMADSS